MFLDAYYKLDNQVKNKFEENLNYLYHLNINH